MENKIMIEKRAPYGAIGYFAIIGVLLPLFTLAINLILWLIGDVGSYLVGLLLALVVAFAQLYTLIALKLAEIFSIKVIGADAIPSAPFNENDFRVYRVGRRWWNPLVHLMTVCFLFFSVAATYSSPVDPRSYLVFLVSFAICLGSLVIILYESLDACVLTPDSACLSTPTGKYVIAWRDVRYAAALHFRFREYYLLSPVELESREAKRLILELKVWNREPGCLNLSSREEHSEVKQYIKEHLCDVGLIEL